MNRRFYSVLAVCFTLALLIGHPSRALATPTCAAPWSSATAYTTGMTASESGVNYVANWWTQGNDPATNNGGSGTGEPWTSQGACGSSSCTTAPGALTVSSSGTTSTATTLSWTTPTEGTSCTLTGYEVYQGGTAKAAVTAGTTSYAATGLTASTAYSFYIAATNSDGTTDSNTLSVTTLAAGCASVPGTPTSLAASGTTSSSTTLSWTASTVGSGCTVSSYTITGGPSTVTSTGTSATIGGLTASTAYTFSLKATDSDGASSAATVSVTTSPTSSATCAVAWSATTAYTAGMTASYLGNNYTAAFWTEGNIPSSNSGGTGTGEPWSLPTACSSNTCSSAPGSFTVSASGTTNTGTTLAWTVPTEATSCTLTGYEVYQGGATKAAVAAGTTTYAVTGLTAGTAYSFDIAATNSDGTTDSNTLPVTTTGTNPCTAAPGVPTGLTGSSSSSTTASLSWTASTVPGGCTLTNYTITGGPSSETSTGTSSTVSGLTPNTSYTFTVKATDSFGTSAASSAVTVKTLNGPSSYFVGGWYEEWGTYYANYNVSDLLNTGMVPSLTHVIYAFAKPSASGCVLADTYADYQKTVPLLTGAPALPTGLAGNFGGLWQLKQLYPNLKILLSIGGWNPPTYNQAFEAASASEASRQAFVSSCINTFIDGNIASGLTVPNLFDGFDIDWEFPNASDTSNFTALITEFRNELTTLSGTTGKTYQVVADLAAGASTPGAAADSGNDGGYDTIDIPGLSAELDYMNVDGYNYAGDWSAATDEGSPLYDDSLDSANALYPDDSIDATVKYYLAHGAPAAKYTMGMPLYGVGWAGGLTSTNSGIYQTATGEVDPTGATTTNGTAAVPNTNGVGECPTGGNQSSPTTGCDFLLTDGMATYRTVENLISAGGYTVSYDSTRIDVNMFNPTTDTVWSFDNPTSIAAKIAYIKANGLGGAYVWAVKDDDTNGSLTKALGNGLN